MLVLGGGHATLELVVYSAERYLPVATTPLVQKLVTGCSSYIVTTRRIERRCVLVKTRLIRWSLPKLSARLSRCRFLTIHARGGLGPLSTRGQYTELSRPMWDVSSHLTDIIELGGSLPPCEPIPFWSNCSEKQ